jgi:hypothetical protein
MKRFAAALAAVLAASCSSLYGERPEDARDFTLDLPPGCRFSEMDFSFYCAFRNAAGREQYIKTLEFTSPFDDRFDQPETARAAMRKDPRAFWTGIVEATERNTPLGVAIPIVSTRSRAFGPPPGAEACLRVAMDAIDLVGGEPVPVDIQGARCILYDPATDLVEDFVIKHNQWREPGTPPDPGFPAEAGRLLRTLRFAPPGG